MLIDIENQYLLRKDTKIRLTFIECRLLELLINNTKVPLSRAFILTNIWGYTVNRLIDTRIVDVNISRLRSKVEDDSTKPELIITIRGTGYMFQGY